MVGSRPAAWAPGGRGGVAAGDLIGEDDAEELGVAQLVGLRQRQPFGERVDELTQLEAAQRRDQIGRVERGCDGHRVTSRPAAKWAGSRANRPTITLSGTGSAAAGLGFESPFDHADHGP